tara:strand:- start:107 stop:391 length:285 start_codon:yes stop_codon:yes gene_type:complete
MSIFLFLTILISPAAADGLTTLSTCAILDERENFIRFDLHPKQGLGLWYESITFEMKGISYRIPLEFNYEERSFVGILRGIKECALVENIQYEQ